MHSALPLEERARRTLDAEAPEIDRSYRAKTVAVLLNRHYKEGNRPPSAATSVQLLPTDPSRPAEPGLAPNS